MKILAFGASNSKKSINQQLAAFAASLIDEAEIRLLDLNDFEMPIYSIDRESETGIPQLAHDFFNAITEADGVIISFAEHNGAYSAAFKNIFDWASRINGKVYQGKNCVFLATSTGVRGGAKVLNIAATEAPFRGGVITGRPISY